MTAMNCQKISQGCVRFYLGVALLLLSLLWLNPAMMAAEVLKTRIIKVPRDHPTIQAGIDAAQDGDLVLVSPGAYKENLSLTGKTITLASEFYITQDTSLISETIIDGGGRTAITVETPVEPEAKHAGISIVGFTIRNGENGIWATGKLQITNNRITGNRADGIDLEGGGCICRNNFFENNADDAIDLDRDSEGTIEHNVIQNNGDDGIEIRLHPYTGPVLNIIIRNNVISGNGKDGIQLIDYGTDARPDLSQRFFLIEHNLIDGNGKAGLGLMNNAKSSEDFRAASIPERIHVFNNSFINNDHGLTGGNNLIALNNLFVNSVNLGIKQVDGRSIVAHNLFWNNGTDEQGSNLDGTNLFADPLLNLDNHLLPGSPAIDAGTAFFEWQGETVMDRPGGKYSGMAPDLGAFEHACESPDTAAPSKGDDHSTGRRVEPNRRAKLCSQ